MFENLHLLQKETLSKLGTLLFSVRFFAEYQSDYLQALE